MFVLCVPVPSLALLGSLLGTSARLGRMSLPVSVSSSALKGVQEGYEAVGRLCLTSGIWVVILTSLQGRGLGLFLDGSVMLRVGLLLVMRFSPGFQVKLGLARG